MGVHYERARLLSQQGRYEQAASELREELAENPHWGLAHAFLGRCLAQQKRMTEAVAEGEEGVRLAPDLPYAHYMLGLTYNDCGRPKEAEAALEEALRLDPRNVDQISYLSWLQFQRGDRRAALATADQGLAIDPEHIACLSRRGYYLRWQGAWKESEEALRAALKLDPENGYTHTNLAWTLWSKAHALAGAPGFLQPWTVSRRPELSEALGHFQEALRRDPGWDWAKTGVAEVLLLRSRAAFRGLMAAVGALTFLLLFLECYRTTPSNEFYFMGLLLVGCGVLVVAFSNGPLYALMARNPLGAAVLSPGRLLAARCTTACLAVSAVSAVAAFLAPPPTGLALPFLSLALVGPLTVASEMAPGWSRKLMTAYAAVLAAAGLTCAVFLWSSDWRRQGPASAVLLLGGTVASLRSSRVGRFLEKLFEKKPG